jgi:clan AA aspartic protease
MGLVYADLELINATDLVNAKRSIIGEEEVKRMRINMLVDSGAYMMATNDTIQAQLDLPFIEKRKAQMASGEVVEYEVVGPLMIKFANRTATCSAFVLPGQSEPLLGNIPMEEMDVLIHPQPQELVVNPDHPNYAQLKMK